MDIYEPVEPLVASRTIRYDRRPRRSGVVAIGIAITAAVLVLVLVWSRLALMGGHIAAILPQGIAGRAVAARHKDTDETEGPDPILAGGADEELAATAHQRWTETAAKAGIDLSGFDPVAPLAKRSAWARSLGLQIGTILARYSSKMQHSTEAQVEETVEFAAWHKIYVPSEFVCVDEGISGRKSRRDGLLRCKAILERRLADTLLVFKVSRLFRVAYLGYAFFQENIVEEGLRAISVSQGIDTADERGWKKLAYLHGIMDEMLLETIADHVRSGLKSLAQKGYITGALTVGYRPVEVPGAPPTNRGKPRTIPGIVAEVAELIRQHFVWICDGMPIKEGWRRWVTAAGPYDRRSKLGHMSYNAYRRMLSNPRYTGRFAFGRHRNVWSNKREYTRQVIQPDTEVVIYQCEDLRIVNDELFQAVQRHLAELKLGPRGPKKRKNSQLWDLVTDLFYCATCKVRFYQSGAHGLGMCCKRGDLCPCKSVVRRKEAVQAVCAKLAELLQRDRDLIHQTVLDSQQFDARGDETLHGRAAELEKKIAAATRKIDDLAELAGQGTDADRAAMKAKVRLAQSERAAFELDLAQVRKAVDGATETITPEQVEEILARLPELLVAGANGSLGADIVYRTASIFRRLVGGRIWVHVERRPGRKRTKIRGVFRPALLLGVQAELGHHVPDHVETPEVEVWLRRPPRLDALAERAHQLIDIELLGYREAAKVLQAEGHKVNSGNVWYSYRRYYEMHDLAVPKRPYNNGRPRKSR